MGTEQLKNMKERLMSCVQNQLGRLNETNTHELGEAIDMIKDLSEAIYYCTITDSMEKVDKDKEPQMNFNYYTTPTHEEGKYAPSHGVERMYYPAGSGMSTNYYTEWPVEMARDPREGRSPMRRRTYMEGKEQHKDKNSQLRELEEYLKELSSDITEMVKDASPEERVTLREKMATLANKIN